MVVWQKQRKNKEEEKTYCEVGWVSIILTFGTFFFWYPRKQNKTDKNKDTGAG